MTAPARIDVLRAELVEITEALGADDALASGPEGRDLRARKAELEAEVAALEALEENVTPEVEAALNPPEVVDAEPMDYAPSGAALVVTGDDEQEVFAVLDRHDERAIMEELQRRGTQRLFYNFDGHVDLSIHGVLEAIGLMNRTGKVQIAVEPSSAVIEVVQLDGKPHVKARVYARDAVTGFGVFGTSTQEQYMKRRNGSEVFDKFAETKALNKAQRNALGMCIPQPIRQAMIAQVTKDSGLMRDVQHGVGAAEMAELPPADTSPEAEALRVEIQAAYDELRGVDVTLLLPGQYHVTLQQASHSVVELRAFLGWLNAKLETAKAGAA